MAHACVIAMLLAHVRMPLRLCQHETGCVCELLVWLSTSQHHNAQFGFQAVKEDARRTAAAKQVEIEKKQAAKKEQEDQAQKEKAIEV